jgi:two-component system response regulator DegU
MSFPEVAIIVLSMYDTEEVQDKVLGVGGTAFISKTAGSDKLLKLIEQVQNKRFSKTDKQTVGNKFRERTTLPVTPREKEILMCISQGMQTLEIAQHLFIKPQTIKNHLTNILKKLNVTDRTQAVLLAARLGWLTKTE